MFYADELKLRLLDWLLSHRLDNEIIGTEVQFSDGRFRADVVLASDSRLSAIEIKAPKDDLRRLLAQVDGYGRMFLDLYIATTDEHATEVKNLVPSAVGLILVSPERIEITRVASSRNALEPDESLSWLRTEDLRGMFQNQAGDWQKLDIARLRETAKQIFPASRLSTAALISIQKRLRPRFEAFLKEWRGQTTVDDLRMLQLPDRIV